MAPVPVFSLYIEIKAESPASSIVCMRYLDILPFLFKTLAVFKMAKAFYNACCTLPMFVLFTFLFYQSQLTQQFSPQTTEQRCSITPLAKSVNNFGASLTKAIGGKDNLFMSSLSIYDALAMTYIGARGKTADQMEDAFQLEASGLDKPKLNEAFQNYLTTIEAGNDQYSLLIANGMFLQQNYAIRDEYVNDLKKYYHAVVEKEDFVNDGKKAKDNINKFVATNTKNKIEKLFDEPLEQNTILVLVNAIYFKGMWKKQFPVDKTKDGIFYKNDGSTKTVEFMELEYQKFRYFADDKSGFQFLELPYKGGDISMLFALPRDRQQAPVLDMTAEFLCSVNGSLRNSTIDSIMIPKFKLKFRKELVNTLRELGIKDLFTDFADLTGISAGGNLKVSLVLHEAVIEVNEEGSEAAAVTGVVVVLTSININQINFIANHPFLFYIIDKKNGMLLFSGRVSDP